VEIFPQPLDLRARPVGPDGKRLWEILRPFPAVTSLGIITTPAGFITDLASVPRILWPAYSPFDDYLESAIPHDWGYSPLNDRFTRRQIDDMMLELMFNSGVSARRRHAVHTAVRRFGWRSYKGKLP
jgi:hypothetical protein